MKLLFRSSHLLSVPAFTATSDRFEACKASNHASRCGAQSATEELERLEHAFDRVKKQLFDRLHGILREQLFHDAPVPIAATTAVAAAGTVPSRDAPRHPQLRAHSISADSDDDDEALDPRVAAHSMENNGA